MNESKFISDDLHKKYVKRLQKPYKKHGEYENFYEQFQKGGGKELKQKFRNIKSSSRLCFDLYSWIANSPECIDIRFEYKLPGICSGNTQKQYNPFMDVFIETEADIYFIESKYQENKTNNSKYPEVLPEAYWKELSENDMVNSGDYYHNTKGKLVQKPLLKRYNNHEELLPFKKFCESIVDWSKNLKSRNVKSWWFDAKQETCHLFGIIGYILEHINCKKAVHFYNIYYDFNETTAEQAEFTKTFIEKAKTLVSKITDKVRFDYNMCTVQDVLAKYGDRPAYGLEDTHTVRDMIDTYPKGRI